MVQLRVKILLVVLLRLLLLRGHNSAKGVGSDRDTAVTKVLHLNLGLDLRNSLHLNWHLPDRNQCLKSDLGQSQVGGTVTKLTWPNPSHNRAENCISQKSTFQENRRKSFVSRDLDFAGNWVEPEFTDSEKSLKFFFPFPRSLVPNPRSALHPSLRPRPFERERESACDDDDDGT